MVWADRKAGTSGEEERSLGPRNDVLTTSKAVTLRGGQRIIALSLADLSNIPWDSAYICDYIDDIHDHWHHLFINAVDQHLPFKKKYIEGDQLPWITLEIYSAISRRDILFRKFKGNKSDDNWEQFKKQRNLAAALKRLRNPISFRLLLNVPTLVNSGKKIQAFITFQRYSKTTYTTFGGRMVDY